MKPRGFFRDNALSIVMLGAFLVFWAGQAVTGWLHHNEERAEHGREPLAFSAYLASGDFLESTAENWESEFFQMAAFVFLSALLVQRGSAESKDPGAREESPQAEFLSVGAIVVLSIFLRQKGSPESKAVAAPHARTGH